MSDDASLPCVDLGFVTHTRETHVDPHVGPSAGSVQSARTVTKQGYTEPPDDGDCDDIGVVSSPARRPPDLRNDAFTSHLSDLIHSSPARTKLVLFLCSRRTRPLRIRKRFSAPWLKYKWVRTVETKTPSTSTNCCWSATP